MKTNGLSIIPLHITLAEVSKSSHQNYTNIVTTRYKKAQLTQREARDSLGI